MQGTGSGRVAPLLVVIPNLAGRGQVGLRQGIQYRRFADARGAQEGNRLSFPAPGLEPARAVGVLQEHLAERGVPGVRVEHDDLTDLPNRVLLNDRLHAGLARAGRDGKRLAVVYLDLDNFKSVNDNYGHLAGSSVLVDVAQLIQESVRPEDVVARYGGDEFTVIQLGLTAPQSVQYAERIVENVRNYHYREIKLTVSIGIASFPEHGSTPEAILSKADKAMYKRKMNNKNGIEIAD